MNHFLSYQKTLSEKSSDWERSQSQKATLPCLCVSLSRIVFNGLYRNQPSFCLTTLHTMVTERSREEVMKEKEMDSFLFR